MNECVCECVCVHVCNNIYTNLYHIYVHCGFRTLTCKSHKEALVMPDPNPIKHALGSMGIHITSYTTPGGTDMATKDPSEEWLHFVEPSKPSV